MNYKLTISFDGTNYAGWQIQPSEKTIQGEIQTSIRKIFNNEKIILIGSGRTDSGVHANNQIANFISENKIKVEKVKDAINSNLDDDIYIKSCEIAPDEFHSRFSAVKRSYIYNISNSFNVFEKNIVWHNTWDIDKNLLIQCADYIESQREFKNFCKAISKKEDNRCKIYFSKWLFDNNTLQFKIEANRFLHHMVRFLVGTMIEVGRGRYTLDEFKSLFCENNSIAVLKAPAKGLILDKIYF